MIPAGDSNPAIIQYCVGRADLMYFPPDSGRYNQSAGGDDSTPSPTVA